MTRGLAALVRRELAAPMPDAVRAMAQALGRAKAARAVLFYGSILRTGDLDGVLDFYLLTDGPHRSGLHGLAERWLWPEVSYHQQVVDGLTLQAKAATLPLATFREAAAGGKLDTTIWTRFVQPAALAWAVDDAAAEEVTAALAAACETAGRFAAVLGPVRGSARDYWTALFRRTYAAELRMEKPGREAQILGFDPARYDALLPLAWESAGIAFTDEAGVLCPQPQAAGRLRAAWGRRQRWGKALNVARLVKAAFTFEGASRYAAWKVERHTGVRLDVTPWRERHPVLAAPGAALQLWRARRKSA